MKLDAYFTPYFPETETQFDNSIVVMIDVLRASTVVCAALHNGAKEIIACEAIDKAVSIYSNLDKENRFLGGERNGLKPDGFDAGNSPLEYSEEKVYDRSIILTTTNGTRTFNKAKNAKARIIGAFVNIDVVLDYIEQMIRTSEQELEIYFLCAGTDGRLSYEDLICAGAFIHTLSEKHSEVSLTDTADVAKNLFNLHQDDLLNFIKTRSHSVHLQNIGFEADITDAMTLNKYPVIPVIDGHSIKKI